MLVCRVRSNNKRPLVARGVVLPKVIENPIGRPSGIFAFTAEEPEISVFVDPPGSSLPAPRRIARGRSSLRAIDPILVNEVGTGHRCRNKYPVTAGIFPKVVEESEASIG